MIDPWESVGVLVLCADRHGSRVWMLMALCRRYASARGCPGRDVSVLLLLAEVLSDSNAHQGSGEDHRQWPGSNTFVPTRPEMTANWFPGCLSGILRR